jgi:hypothetical protein
MPYREGSRKWWKGVASNRCQYESYSEEDGFRQCNREAKHVHHIRPEGWQLSQGDDPEQSVGMPICEEHHLKNQGTEPHSQNFSFHPDMGEARREYYKWKQKRDHYEALTGEKYPEPSPFVVAAQEHALKAKEGERYHSGSDEIDDYYEAKMKHKSAWYAIKTGEKKPHLKPHPKTKRKSRWYDDLF